MNAKRSSLATTAVCFIVAAAAVGCARTSEGAGVRADGDAVAPRCPLDVAGGFPARATAGWARAIVERAGYEVVDSQHTGLVAVGRGREFRVWTTEPGGPHSPRLDEHPVLATLDGVEVRGHPEFTRWWPAQGHLFWVGRGRLVESRSPHPDELGPLVDASLEIPAPTTC